MIGHEERTLKIIERQEDMLGNAGEGRSHTATLRVSPNGTGADGLSWRTAYQTIQEALDAASTSGGECTLILIGPHATYYDINTTGDPTWAANVILQGTHRHWAEIRNDHATAASILRFTGKAGVADLNFNLGTAAKNGVIMTQSGARVKRCMFDGSSLTDAPATALWLDHATGGSGAKIIDCDIFGHVDNMIGMMIDQFGDSCYEQIRIHQCHTGININGANADYNCFTNLDIGECVTGIDIDSGNEQHFNNINFHHNGTNVDDEVHDHIWNNIFGDFPIRIEPDNLTGVTLTANAAANVWGVDTEIRAAVTSTVPFRVVAILVDPQIAQWYQLRLSDDSGSTFFDQVGVNISRTAGSEAPAGTGYIFNAGTRISGSIKAESAGSDTMQVWLKIQEI